MNKIKNIISGFLIVGCVVSSPILFADGNWSKAEESVYEKLSNGMRSHYNYAKISEDIFIVKDLLAKKIGLDSKRLSKESAVLLEKIASSIYLKMEEKCSANKIDFGQECFVLSEDFIENYYAAHGENAIRGALFTEAVRITIAYHIARKNHNSKSDIDSLANTVKEQFDEDVSDCASSQFMSGVKTVAGLGLAALAGYGIHYYQDNIYNFFKNMVTTDKNSDPVLDGPK